MFRDARTIEKKKVSPLSVRDVVSRMILFQQTSCEGTARMTQPSTKVSKPANQSVAFQYVQQEIARDMAVLYKAFSPQVAKQQPAGAGVRQSAGLKRTGK